VRVFSSVIQITAGPVLDLRQDLTLRHAVAAQAVSDDAAGLELETGEQALEEAFRGGRIPAVLHEDVEHNAMLVHCAPEVVQHAVDPQEDLIQVPAVARLRPAPAQPPGEVGPEPQAPLPDALVGDRDPTFGQDQLDVAQAQAKNMIQSYGVADDLGREAVAGVGGEVRLHPASFAQLGRSGQKPSTWRCRCEAVSQAPAPSLPIRRGCATAGLLAHVLVAKYADHLPLYRQSEIYARAGIDLQRSTLAD
jgi:hypothetical protein